MASWNVSSMMAFAASATVAHTRLLRTFGRAGCASRSAHRFRSATTVGLHERARRGPPRPCVDRSARYRCRPQLHVRLEQQALKLEPLLDDVAFQLAVLSAHQLLRRQPPPHPHKMHVHRVERIDFLNPFSCSHTSHLHETRHHGHRIPRVFGRVPASPWSRTLLLSGGGPRIGLPSTPTRSSTVEPAWSMI
jgi:hypothetical protein